MSEEFGADLFATPLQDVKPRHDDIITGVAMLTDHYAFDSDNSIILQRTPEMARNPLYKHGLASSNKKGLTKDAWVRVQNPNHIPPELLKEFDRSLLEPSGRIPEGNASYIAFVNYTLRTLQMICFANLTCSSTSSCGMPGSVRGVWCLLSCQPLGPHPRLSSTSHGSRCRMESGAA